MENEEHIVRYTMAELKAKKARGESKTNWARIDAMTDEELEASIDREEEGEFDLSRAFAGLPPLPGTIVTVRIAAPVVAWFKASGGDYAARIRSVLRDYVDAQQAKLATVPPRQQRRAS